MKAVYTIKVRSGVSVPVPPGTPELILGSSRVGWKTDAAGHLAAVTLELNGAEIRLDDRGIILSTYPDLEEHAYRLAHYVANRIYVQTGFDAIDAQSVLLGSPDIHAETASEEITLKAMRRQVSAGLSLSWFVIQEFAPESYQQGFDHSVAWSYFTDAQRAASVFQQVESLYKVVEYFSRLKIRRPKCRMRRWQRT